MPSSKTLFFPEYQQRSEKRRCQFSSQKPTVSLPMQATTTGLNCDHQVPSCSQELPRFQPTEYTQVLQQLQSAGPQPSSTAHLDTYDDIPTQYVKDIQSGEFFELSKLLPQNLSPMNTLENSVIRVSRNSSSTSITNIEDR